MLADKGARNISRSKHSRMFSGKFGTSEGMVHREQKRSLGGYELCNNFSKSFWNKCRLIYILRGKRFSCLENNECNSSVMDQLHDCGIYMRQE